MRHPYAPQPDHDPVPLVLGGRCTHSTSFATHSAGKTLGLGMRINQAHALQAFGGQMFWGQILQHQDVHGSKQMKVEGHGKSKLST